MRETTSREVIKKLKEIFSRHGIPDVLVSDNGPQYSSKLFKEFSTKWEFAHLTSSPGYPQSNGMAERMVQTAKNVLKKAEQSNQDPHLALLELRNTPIDSDLQSPAQILMGRRLKSTLPASKELLKPQNHSDFVRHTLVQKQHLQKEYFNRQAKPLTPISEGDVVRVINQTNGTWEPAVVKSKLRSPRSFHVQTQQGTLRRNRKHLLKTRESPPNLNQPFYEAEIQPTIENDQEPHDNVVKTSSGRVVIRPKRFIEQY